MTARSTIRNLRAFGLGAFFLVGAAFGQSGSSASVTAVLEVRGRQFFYAGDPIPLGITLGNSGDASVANPIVSGLSSGFHARDASGAPISLRGDAGVSEPPRPGEISPKSSYRIEVDATKLFPDLRRPGQYSIGWAAGGVASEDLTIRVIPGFDPTQEYVARVETSEGSFSIEFFNRIAPIAVKAFVDLCNAGFYDGLTFHKVLPDSYIEGGDSAGDGYGPPPFSYPSELANVPLVAGMVLMKPTSPAPPSNGSQFLILLRPEASWTGQATVLGRVLEGLDVVGKISRMPSSDQALKPSFRPLEEVKIHKITIRERSVSSRSSSRNEEP